MDDIFQTLNKLDFKEHIEKKKSGSKFNDATRKWEDNYLSYLSWTWAWAEVKKIYPNVSYEIIMHNGLPYVYDENTGYMVFTSVTIEGTTHMMWLPVMDGANNAMKSHEYSYHTKAGKEVAVSAATMFDINKTIMRCLVKNLAMFGLGLYIYAGEDLPEGADDQTEEKKEQPKQQTQKKAEEPKLAAVVKAEEPDPKARVLAYIKKCNMPQEKIDMLCKSYNVESIEKMNIQQCKHYIGYIEKNGGNI